MALPDRSTSGTAHSIAPWAEGAIVALDNRGTTPEMRKGSAISPASRGQGIELRMGGLPGVGLPAGRAHVVSEELHAGKRNRVLNCNRRATLARKNAVPAHARPGSISVKIKRSHAPARPHTIRVAGFVFSTVGAASRSTAPAMRRSSSSHAGRADRGDRHRSDVRDSPSGSKLVKAREDIGRNHERRRRQ